MARITRREWLKHSLIGGLGAGYALRRSKAHACCADTEKVAGPIGRTEKAKEKLIGNGKVVIVKRKTLPEALDVAIAAAGGLDFIEPGEKVFLKPSMNSGNPYPYTTATDTLEEVARRLAPYCSEGELWMADKPNFILRTEACYESTGLDKAAERGGAQVRVFENFVPVTHDRAEHWNGEVLLAAEAVQADHIIALPRLATHITGDFTMAMKIHVGLVKATDRLYLHMPISFKQRVAELSLFVRPSLIVLDARRALYNWGPDWGDHEEKGLILAGTDPVAMDLVGLAILKTCGEKCSIYEDPITEIPTMKRALELGITVGSPKEVEIMADGLAPAELQAIKSFLV
jgi:uncharacterized protein (DUF362 family)